MRNINWAEVEWEYMNGEMSLRELAEKRGMSSHTLWRKAAQEKWVKRRREMMQRYRKLELEQVADRLLWRMTETIEARETLEARDIKALSAALKAISELEQPRGSSGQDRQELIVRLEGELKELSQ